MKNAAPPKNLKGWEALKYWGTRHFEFDCTKLTKAIALVKKRYGKIAHLVVTGSLIVKGVIRAAMAPEVSLAALDRVLEPKLAKAIRAQWGKDGDDFYFPKQLLWKSK